MTINFNILDKEKETAKGFPVVILIRHQNKRKKRIFCHAKLNQFSKESQLVTEKHPDYDFLIYRMLEIKEKAKKIIYSNERNFEKIFDMLLSVEAETAKYDFYQLANLVLDDMKKEVQQYEDAKNYIARNKAAGNYKIYNSCLKVYKELSPQLAWEDIDQRMILMFKKIFMQKGLAKNTVHNYLRTLRAIYNKISVTYRKENLKPFDGVFKGLTVKSYNTKKKYITKDDIYKLENYRTTAAKQIYVDLALLQFYFGGCDLIDLYFLKKNQVFKDRVFINRGKTNDDLLIEMFITEKAAAILEKYKNDSIFIFDFRKDGKGYETFRSRYTRALIEVQKQLEIDVLPMGGALGVKVFRHTFANIAKNLFIEPDLIRELMGHQRDEVDNYYKDVFPEALRREALLKIIS